MNLDERVTCKVGSPSDGTVSRTRDEEDRVEERLGRLLGKCQLISGFYNHVQGHSKGLKKFLWI